MNDFDKLLYGSLGGILAFGIICYIGGSIDLAKIDTSTKKPGIETYYGYEPGRPVSEIRKVDYENKRVYYHEPNNGTVRIATEPLRSSSSGVTLKNGNRTIDTGLTSEEIFDQICRDIDFDDFADYYGYYLESY